jgi:hypothetical protein
VKGHAAIIRVFRQYLAVSDSILAQARLSCFQPDGVKVILDMSDRNAFWDGGVSEGI